MQKRLWLVMLPLAAAAACSRGGTDETAFVWSNQVPPGAVVHIRNGAGNLTLNRAAGPGVSVHATRSWHRGRASDIRFVVEQRGTDYYVCAMWRNSGRCAESGYRGRNTGGLLAMFSLFHRTSDASADFTAEIPANVVVDARTSSGSVQIDGLNAGVSARTINGTIRASNVSGSLNLATTNGDVRVSADSFAPTDSIHLTTTNGSVHAELPANLEGVFDLSVVNGVVRSDFPLQAAANSRLGRHLEGQVGTVPRVVRMRAINGQVIVTSRGAPVAGQ